MTPSAGLCNVWKTTATLIFPFFVMYFPFLISGTVNYGNCHLKQVIFFAEISMVTSLWHNSRPRIPFSTENRKKEHLRFYHKR